MRMLQPGIAVPGSLPLSLVQPLGGLMIAIFQSAALVYIFDAAAGFVFVVLLLLIREALRQAPPLRSREHTALSSLVEGFLAFCVRPRSS